ncbi:hypothetical protein [Pseudomonas mucidolens]|uniref:Uncharacterized protein n=1 Tax=Pseudomonas mucidolens TaxID=46679 RepID=A0A1H2M0A7_9PSED|nr:hypothetical protein [Pseudomonas mucidolens]SDU86683.1 hypothetical protein SAMN05216202_0805 [Pseudomonas mucidolens]SQH34866.1 Uncharacterised protein [Pseudomonas mucidolens]
MIQNILFVSLAIVPFAAFSAALTVENQSTNAGVIVDKELYPACEPHPGNSAWCMLPPTRQLVYTLPSYASKELTFVSLIETKPDDQKPDIEYKVGTNGRAYQLLGSGSYTYNSSESSKTQRLSCNTLGKPSTSQISISIPEQFNQTCTGPHDQFVKWVDNRDDLEMRIDFKITTASTTAIK